jgi:hypothetical protein
VRPHDGQPHLDGERVARSPHEVMAALRIRIAQAHLSDDVLGVSGIDPSGMTVHAAWPEERAQGSRSVASGVRRISSTTPARGLVERDQPEVATAAQRSR